MTTVHLVGGLRIVQRGWSTTIQDEGRPGLAALGVPRAGAVDRSASALANRLVGNPAGAAALETAGGLVVEPLTALIVATSADGARHTLRAGERLRVDAPEGGMWGYLAVRGGLDVDAVLGSRSHDTLSGLGPPPLTDGTVLPVGPEPPGGLSTELAPRRPGGAEAAVWPGPHADRFGGLAELVGRPWTVATEVSRVGIRLGGARLVRTTAADEPDTMASFGLVEGAVQVTGAGEPIVMLANHPATGGYPVVAVVDPADIAVVAQARPGSPLRFRTMG